MRFYGYRYYKPDIGRWVNRDPMLDPGSPPVMAIRAFLLDLLEQLFLLELETTLDENLSDEARVRAISHADFLRQISDSVLRNEPDVWLTLAGNNLFLFCANYPVGIYDLLGLTVNDPCQEDDWPSRLRVFIDTVLRRSLGPVHTFFRDTSRGMGESLRTSRSGAGSAGTFFRLLGPVITIMEGADRDNITARANIRQARRDLRAVESWCDDLRSTNQIRNIRF